MRTRGLAAVLAILCSGCSGVIQGYAVRESRAAETRRVGEILDPLLLALELPSLRAVGQSGCKIGFAVVRTDKVNVWSRPATAAPCTHFSLFVTEGALAAPSDELMAMIAHELGHLMLRHTPQADGRVTPSDAAWQGIQAQELEADRFAVALLKRMKDSPVVASCEAMGRFLRRGVADWYGETISTRMADAVTERVESAESACASADVTLAPPVIPVSLAPPSTRPSARDLTNPQ
jgi:Zn-dependent protease with chaperone function